MSYQNGNGQGVQAPGRRCSIAMQGKDKHHTPPRVVHTAPSVCTTKQHPRFGLVVHTRWSRLIELRALRGRRRFCLAQRQSARAAVNTPQGGKALFCFARARNTSARSFCTRVRYAPRLPGIKGRTLRSETRAHLTLGFAGSWSWAQTQSRRLSLGVEVGTSPGAFALTKVASGSVHRSSRRWCWLFERAA